MSDFDKNELDFDFNIPANTDNKLLNVKDDWDSSDLKSLNFSDGVKLFNTFDSAFGFVNGKTASLPASPTIAGVALFITPPFAYSFNSLCCIPVWLNTILAKSSSLIFSREFILIMLIRPSRLAVLIAFNMAVLPVACATPSAIFFNLSSSYTVSSLPRRLPISLIVASFSRAFFMLSWSFSRSSFSYLASSTFDNNSSGFIKTPITLATTSITGCNFTSASPKIFNIGVNDFKITSSIGAKACNNTVKTGASDFNIASNIGANVSIICPSIGEAVCKNFSIVGASVSATTFIGGASDFTNESSIGIKLSKAPVSANKLAIPIAAPPPMAKPFPTLPAVLLKPFDEFAILTTARFHVCLILAPTLLNMFLILVPMLLNTFLILAPTLVNAFLILAPTLLNVLLISASSNFALIELNAFFAVYLIVSGNDLNFSITSLYCLSKVALSTDGLGSWLVDVFPGVLESFLLNITDIILLKPNAETIDFSKPSGPESSFDAAIPNKIVVIVLNPLETTTSILRLSPKYSFILADKPLNIPPVAVFRLVIIESTSPPSLPPCWAWFIASKFSLLSLICFCLYSPTLLAVIALFNDVISSLLMPSTPSSTLNLASLSSLLISVRVIIFWMPSTSFSGFFISSPEIASILAISSCFTFSIWPDEIFNAVSIKPFCESALKP